MLKFLFRQIYKKKQIIKYLIAGSTAAAIDLLSLYVLTSIFGVWYLYSAVLAFLAAFFVSFNLQKFWTFRDDSKKKIHKQMAIYFAVAGVNLCFNAGGMFILVDKFSIPYILAQIIMGGFLATESFLIYKFFIFRKQAGELIEKSGKIRILIATGIFPPSIGGPATYAEFLRKELRNLGCEVGVVSYGDKNIQNKNDNLYIIDNKQNILFKYIKYFFLILKLAQKFDIVYILDLMSAGFPATMAATLKGKKVVFRTGGDFLWEKAFNSDWTDLPLDSYYKAKKNWREKFLMYFCRSILEAIDIVIFSTNLQKDIYKNYYNLKDKKIRFTGNAIPFIEIEEENKEYNNSIVFAGRLIELKNIERLIGAFNASNRKDEKLLIFGDGPLKEKIEKQISDLGLKDNILIEGAVRHGELLKAIAGCKFVILPSITEISPNLALECISMAKPIILTKNTGLSEDIVDKIIKVDPLSEDDIREKINYLLLPDNLAAYQKKLFGMKLPERSWRDLAQEHLNIFRELL